MNTSEMLVVCGGLAPRDAIHASRLLRFGSRSLAVFLNLNSQTGSYRVGKSLEEGDLDEPVKPLIGIQRVEVPLGESLAGTPVASVAIHRVTGG